MADMNVDPRSIVKTMLSNLDLCEWGELGGQRFLAVQLWQGHGLHESRTVARGKKAGWVWAGAVLGTVLTETR